MKAAAVATAKALPKGPIKRAVKRAIAKAEGKTPELKRYAATGRCPSRESGSRSSASTPHAQCYLDRCAEPDVDLDAEQKIVFDALLEIAGKRAISGGQVPKPQPRRCPQDGRSEDGPL